MVTVQERQQRQQQKRALRTAAARAALTCPKQGYFMDQATARVALEKIRAKGSGKKPVRVYPCDRCDGWHLTSKPSRKNLPWDLDPNWVRPAPKPPVGNANMPIDRRRS